MQKPSTKIGLKKVIATTGINHHYRKYTQLMMVFEDITIILDNDNDEGEKYGERI